LPYTEKEKKLRQHLVKQYGLKKGLRVYNAMETQAAEGKKHTKNFGEEAKKRRKKRLHIS
jgi:hypothetical protein